MNKIKVNPGLLSIIILASLFAGWSTLLTVVALILLFCETDDTVKGIATRTVTFFVGLSLLLMVWGLIVDGIDLIPDTINGIIGVINCWSEKVISLGKFETYVLNPIKGIVGIADNIISYLAVLTKFAFIIAVLTNKPLKNNAFVNKVNEYINKAIQFVGNINNSQSNK